MADYKLYFLNENGHIFGRIDAVNTTKNDAFRRARELSSEAEIEIWQAATFLGRYLKDGTFSTSQHKMCKTAQAVRGPAETTARHNI